MQEVDRTPINFANLLAMPGVVEALDLQGPVGFCAFHGGNLERMTEQIASEAAARSGSSFYGVIQPHGTRHHIPSAKVDPTQSEKLAAFVDHCQYVIAVHGYGLRGHFASLLCGGQNRELAAHVAGHVRDAVPMYDSIDDVDRIPRSLRGMHAKNPCNLTIGGGMQLELPPRVRGLTPLVWHWPSHDYENRRFPHVNHLIEGLINAAVTWANTSAKRVEPRVPLAQTGLSPMEVAGVTRKVIS
ncbi:MAG: hypothetical protein GY724_26940 [Actinomycetia bacterium]|nr:hypothetical protein [Actinomycetes bacterium]MCP4223088.1 hypothetical protein [Actinomycetes bacterium]MCP5032752.1 hypothetical protein [Actinomycetes bacterium]